MSFTATPWNQSGLTGPLHKAARTPIARRGLGNQKNYKIVPSSRQTAQVILTKRKPRPSAKLCSLNASLNPR